MSYAMETYYAQRAAEYEQIYQRPERQDDLTSLATLLHTTFQGHDVLEIACGTGYWTQHIARSARSVVATDYNAAVLDIARHKAYPDNIVSLQQADAYELVTVSGDFTAAFAGFWLSHVPRVRLPTFLATLHAKLRSGAVVAMLDNVYVEGSSTPIARTDAEGNTYQIRQLSNGIRYEILKNFPTNAALQEMFAPYASSMEIIICTYFWLACYELR
jgi:demethylmenaquinone methyltransferase/2-methoxy-6-polyprenyl-1,4-benzoquinol methylase